MKQSIVWHKARLESLLTSLAAKEELLNTMEIRTDRLREECYVLSEQIDIAISRGMEEFDRREFLKKKSL